VRSLREARRIERERAEAGIPEDWELCEDLRRLRLCEGEVKGQKHPTRRTTVSLRVRLILNEHNGP
jgi:hypothetical protein